MSLVDELDDDLAGLINEACARDPAGADAWMVSPPRRDGSPRRSISAAPVAHRGSAQGWKLHVTATVAEAHEALRCVLPVLVEERVPFKVVASRRGLQALNQGRGGVSQIGKFLTVYPATTSDAVRVAVALDRATSGLDGPVIPSDRCLRPGSAVFYRYGSFKRRVIQTVIGELVPVITGPDGDEVPDERGESYRPPAGITDPFIAAGVSAEAEDPPPTLGGRYVVVRTLQRTARGSVELALDLSGLRRVVLKRAARAAAAAAGGDACDRLRREAEVLARVSPEVGLPQPYELFADGDAVVLAMEDVPGVSLRDYVMRFAASCELPPVSEVLAWGRALAGALARLHSDGWIHGDLKPTNVLMTPAGEPRLVDVDGAVRIGSEGPRLMTPGYCSPAQSSGEPASVADDVYALGALLRFALTGSDSGAYLGGSIPAQLSVRCWNPAVGPHLAAVVSRCLAPDPRDRFASMPELREALAGATAQPDGLPPAPGPQTEPRDEHARGLARRLGDALVALGLPVEPGRTRTWLTDSVAGLEMPTRDLGTGVAGIVLVLGELVIAFDDPAHRAALREGAGWLAQAPAPDGPGAPGLYAGEAGAALGLLRAGQVLADPELVALAATRSSAIARRPHVSPDLYSGSAGRLRFHLMTWEATGDDKQLAFAVAAGDSLLSVKRRGEGRPGWPMPSECGPLARRTWLGYAHGAAGIADCLLDLAEATGEDRWLAPAEETLVLLCRLARPALADASGLLWPIAVEPGPEGGGASWCHGAAGIGRFLLHGAAMRLDAHIDDEVRRAARAVATGARAGSPVQCHGLAGAIEFLVDLARHSGDAADLDAAWSLSALLEAYLAERDGLLLAASDVPGTVTPDYLTGIAGVAACFVRLADPRRPHLLSRSAFAPGSP